MIAKRFTLLTILRVVLLVITVFILSWILGDSRLFFNQIILSLIIVVQVAELIRFVNHSNRELSRFFLAIKHGDFSVTFKQAPLGWSFADLQTSMRMIIDSYKQVKIEKEAQFHLLQILVNQIQVGIISLADDDVVLINPTAERLLGISGLKNWKLIQQISPFLVGEISRLGDQGRKLIETNHNHEQKVLAVDVSSQIILGKQNKLITLQDIHSAIEQKEIEAWHKLIRILTHEIMNSITPISSLTETIQGMLSQRDGTQKELKAITDETISDIRFSLNTIQNRSEGLLHFVENYRKLTRVPKPSVEPVSVRLFMAGVETLMKETLQRQGIEFAVQIEPGNITSLFDPSLMEQVIINLITNSMHALQDASTKKILLASYAQGDNLTFEVTDTGKGILEKELREIFIPFFSTKKDGSGIGLSLSKQIVSQHGGTIRVTSQPNQGTSFFIRLKLK